MPRNNDLVRILRAIPPIWAIVIVSLIIAYWLLTPSINRLTGWHLPRLEEVISEKQTDKKPQQKQSPKRRERHTDKQVDTSKHKDIEPNAGKSVQSNAGATAEKSTGNRSSKSQHDSANSKADESSNRNNDSPYDALQPLGKNRFRSPFGLLYTPGGEEGHRLKHIARHLEDNPSRPGTHGVFDGTMNEFLLAIDETVEDCRKKGKGTSIRQEEGMDVYEADLHRKIGYLGGTEGERKHHPKSTRMRVILNEDRVITAFPY